MTAAATGTSDAGGTSPARPRPVPLPTRLREGTRDLHDAVERGLDWERRVATRAGYRDLLARWYGFHATFEPAAASAFAGEEAFFGPRRKLHLLRRDLLHLGMPAGGVDALPVCRPQVPMPTRAEALGALYVLEGSTLGGQLVARRVGRALGFTARGGCAYYAGYGPGGTGPMWRAFQDALSDQISPETHDAAVHAARRTFERLRDWLAGA